MYSAKRYPDHPDQIIVIRVITLINTFSILKSRKKKYIGRSELITVITLFTLIGLGGLYA